MASVNNAIDSIAYVEPNLIHGLNSDITTDHKDHYMAPALEDYSIALNMEVEVVGRNFDIKKETQDKSVILMSWTDRGGKSTINFMEGKKFYRRDSDRKYDEGFLKAVQNGEESYENHKKIKIGGDYWGYSNGLSTDYTDTFYYDLKDHGTTEMFGISSVDIQYQNWMVPQVTVEFVDIRGGSLLSPTEMRNGDGFHGLQGFSQTDIASSFFQCFFTFPYPRFNIVVKGFYGQPVSYEITCNDFRVKFDSKTGNFNATAKFVGYSFSFMNDVSLLACMAAPYCNALDGSNYWQRKVDEGEFVINDINGQPMPMPKLTELCANYGFILQKAEELGRDDESLKDFYKRKDRINIRQNLYNAYTNFFTKLTEALDNNKLTKDKYGVLMYDDNTTYKAVIALVSEESKNNGTVVSFADSPCLDGDKGGALSTALSELIAVEKNANEILGGKYKTPGDNFKNINIKQIITNLNTPFTNSSFEDYEDYGDVSSDDIRSAFIGKNVDGFDNGRHYTHAFIFSFGNYSRIVNESANDESVIQEKEDEINRIKSRLMVNALGFSPTISNISKIYMAHFETFMYLMYKTIETIQSENRTLEDLGVKNINLPDVSVRTKVIPPFPRVTADVEKNGILRREDAWIGAFNGKSNFREGELVNEIFNGIEQVASVIENTKKRYERSQENTENLKNNTEEKGGIGNPNILYPVCNFDFITSSNPYGSYNNALPANNRREFAGRIFLRMMQILGLGLNGRNLTNSKIAVLASAEAKNFSHIFSNPGDVIRKALNGGTSNNAINADEILKIVSERNKENPWGGESFIEKVGSDISPWALPFKFSKIGYKYGDSVVGDFIHYSPIGSLTLSDANTIANNGNYDINDSNIVSNVAPLKNNDDFLTISDKVNEGVVFFDFNVNRVNNITQRAVSRGGAPEEYGNIMGEIEEFALTFDKDKYAEYFNQNNFNTESLIQNAKHAQYKVKGTVIHNAANTEMYATINSAKTKFHDETDYSTVGTQPEKYAITQFCGFDVARSQITKPYKLRKSYSIFAQKLLRDETDVTKKCAFVLFSLIPMYDFNAILKDIITKRQSIVPYSSVLQIGAIIYMASYKDGKLDIGRLLTIVGSNDNSLNELKKLLDVSPTIRLRFVQEFVKWSKEKYNQIFGVYEYNNVNKLKPSLYREVWDNGNGKIRLFNNETSDEMSKMTSELLKPVRVIKGVSVDENGFNNKTNIGNDYSLITEGMAKVYLDSFLSELAKEYSILRKSTNNNTSNEAVSFVSEAAKATDDMRISFYSYLKLLYDKWVASSNFDEWKMYKFFSDETGSDKLSNGHNFYFIDSFYNKIGDDLFLNVGDMVNKLLMVTDQNNYLSSLLEFLSDMYATNRCLMLSVQNFMDLSDKSNMESMFKPVPFNSMRMPKKHPDFVVLYSYEHSSKINTGGRGEYEDDGFNLNVDEITKNPQLAPIALTSRNVSEANNKGWYRIPAFGVGYGGQYQSYFTDVEVGMDKPMMTEQALQATFSIAAAAVGAGKDGDNKVVSTGQDLFTIYSNNSYTCTVKMMGCAWVQPLMYFMLNNVPMFKGAYLIQEVSHHIEPGRFETTFKGVRMANVQTRLNQTPLLFAVNRSANGIDGISLPNKFSDVDNDCEYKVYPIGVNSDGNESAEITGNEKEKAIAFMDKAIAIWNRTVGSDYGNLSVAQAAGIAGNSVIECGFDPYVVAKDTNGYYSGGIFQLNNTALNILITNGDPKMLFNSPNATHYPNSGPKPIIPQWANTDKQMEMSFLSARGGWMSSRGLGKKLTAAKTPEEAAIVWLNVFENNHSNKLNERRKKAREFYDAYMSTKRGNNGVNVAVPSVNEKADGSSFTQAFFAAVQKTFGNYNTRLSCGLQSKINGNKLIITQSDGGNKHMAQVFDVLLNGYTNNVSELFWNVKNGNEFNSKPISVGVIVSQDNTGGANRCRITSGLTMNNGDMTYSVYPINEVLPTDFFLCLMKKYGKTADSVISNKNFKSDWRNCKPDSVQKEWFNNAELIACQTIIKDAVGVTGMNGGTIVNGFICNWNVEKAVIYIKEHTPPLGQGKTTGKCTQSVRAALIHSGLTSSKNGFGGGTYGYPWEWPEELEGLGFVKIYENVHVASDGSLDGTHLQLQPGDISCLWTSNNATPSRGNKPNRYHVAMWDGSSWAAETKVANVVPYRTEECIVKIYRYKGNC